MLEKQPKNICFTPILTLSKKEVDFLFVISEGMKCSRDAKWSKSHSVASQYGIWATLLVTSSLSLPPWSSPSWICGLQNSAKKGNRKLGSPLAGRHVHLLPDPGQNSVHLYDTGQLEIPIQYDCQSFYPLDGLGRKLSNRLAGL